MKSQLANMITGIRILCALALVFCPTFSVGFFAFYLIGGASDVADGPVARKIGKETAFGAQLDTVADAALASVVILKVLRAVTVPPWVWVWTLCIAAVKCAGIIAGFVLFKRFAAEHTVMNKICGVLLFAVPFYIAYLPWRAAAVFLAVNGAVATVAAAEEAYDILIGKSVR